MSKKREGAQEQLNRIFVETKMVFDFEQRLPESGDPQELILLLHGYAQNGNKILRELEPIFPKNALVLAPNGLFPMPYKTEKGFKVSYSWYFYDSLKEDYFITPDLSVEFLKKGIEQLGLSALPKRIIGFSQGGYLAPFAALALKNITQVVGIGCEYLTAELPASLPFRVDAIHGEQDDVVPFELGKTSHAELCRKAGFGEFHSVPQSGHKIDESIKEVLGKISTH